MINKKDKNLNFIIKIPSNILFQQDDN